MFNFIVKVYKNKQLKKILKKLLKKRSFFNGKKILNQKRTPLLLGGVIIN